MTWTGGNDTAAAGRNMPPAGTYRASLVRSPGPRGSGGSPSPRCGSSTSSSRCRACSATTTTSSTSAGGIAIITAFCVVFVVVIAEANRSTRRSLSGLAALFALALTACILYGGTGATSLWIYVSALTGLVIPVQRTAVWLVAAVTAAYAITSLTSHGDLGDFLINLVPTVLLGLAMIGLRSHFELTRELGEARETVARLAASQERLRLARDMHDLTGQSLSMITLKSELALRLLGRLPAGPDRDRVSDEIEQVGAVSRQTLHDIREAISGYRRPTLAVEVITARAALESAGITPQDDAELTLLSGTFDPDAEAALAWCLREAVTNVVRHSGARTCQIRLSRRGRDAVPGGPRRRPGPRRRGAMPAPAPGCAGMSERLCAVGGSLELRPPGRPDSASSPACRPRRPAPPPTRRRRRHPGRGAREGATVTE